MFLTADGHRLPIGCYLRLSAVVFVCSGLDGTGVPSYGLHVLFRFELIRGIAQRHAWIFILQQISEGC